MSESTGDAGSQDGFDADITADDHRAALLAEAEADRALTTHVLRPRDRIFLPQTFGERVKSFWWSIVRSTMFRWSPPAFNFWRVLLLQAFGARIKGRVVVAPSVRIEFPWNLTLGSNVVLCDHVIVNCMGRVEIGSGTRVSQYSHIISGTHDYTSQDMRIVRRPITIGTNVWIAADAFVGPGVCVGDGCLLAARSSAFRDLPPDQVCMGEPARASHARFEQPDQLESVRAMP
jgi:putative colanic acid biosynthesis acetyltransferase WcaF